MSNEALCLLLCIIAFIIRMMVLEREMNKEYVASHLIELRSRINEELIDLGYIKM